ncbi:MAG TPA: hypothetical protein VFU88_09465 [Ktedonobacterales bacterium]|nr:hypothetical protein [Ktedonobacterales bacterium]
MSQPSANTDEVKRELQATLAARRELGPEYDEHFIQALTEKIMAQVRDQIARTPAPAPPRPRGLAADQRLALAICSLIFLIPLVAIAGGMFGPGGMLTAFGAVVLINLLSRV